MANQSDLKIKIISFVKSNEVAEKNLEEVAELGRKLYEEVIEYYNDANKIKNFVIMGIPEKEQQLLMKTNKIIGRLNSPENKKLKEQRDNILAKVSRYYHRIGRKIFGNKIYNEDNDLAKAQRTDKRKREITESTSEVVSSSINSSQNKSSKELTDHEEDLIPSSSNNMVNISTNISNNESNLGVVSSEVPTRSSSRIANQPKNNVSQPETEVSQPQAKRNRFANYSPTNPKTNYKDSYETQPIDIAVMTNRLKEYFELMGIKNYNNVIAFEPCAGSGNISNALTEMGLKNVISRDKFALPEKHDFLVDKDPEDFDIIVTNPPFSVKEEIIKKVLTYPPTVKVILLLPYQFMATKMAWDNFKDKNIHIDLLSPNPKFVSEHKDKPIDSVSCAWYYFNFPPIQTNISLSICRTIPTLQVSSSGNTQSDGKELAERCFIDEAEEVGEIEEDEIQDYESEGEEEEDDYEDYKRNKKGYCSVA
jgi:hypothetical protein